MSHSLEVLAETALAIESVSAYNEHFAPCTQPGGTYTELEPLDDYGKWYYFLVGCDENFNETFITDKNGMGIWCPFWAYSKDEAIIESLLVVYELYNDNLIDFPYELNLTSLLKRTDCWEIVIKKQYQNLKELEKQTSKERPNQDWFLKFLSARKQILRDKLRALYEQ